VVGDKLLNPLKDFAGPANLVSAKQLQDMSQEMPAYSTARRPKRLSNPMPAEVAIKGPVEVNTKGKLGIDLRISADQGLKVSQSGVDKSGAPNIGGNVGVSTVTP
jgi:hypothetical protein